MERNFNRKLVLEDGSEYYGYGFGADCDRVCELVFNTSMVGYQEMLFDPSCAGQAVVMTYSIIGNYGITDENFENKNPAIGALIVYDYNDEPSNFRHTKTLSDFAEENGIPGIYGFDTRELTRKIRDNGTCKVLITTADTPTEGALSTIKEAPELKEKIKLVSCKKRWYSKVENASFNVVAIDCGIKPGVVKSLNRLSCNVIIVPYDTTAEEIENLRPDGIFVSNGPGSAEEAVEVSETVKRLKGKYPMFGIGLGNEIIALAYGAEIYKLKFGHRGDNHPIRNLETNGIEIASQYHGYAIKEESLAKTPLKITHKNLLDGTIEGISCEDEHVRGVQFYPEGNPEPRESSYLYVSFTEDMRRWQKNA